MLISFVCRLLDDEVQNEPPTTYCTLSDHTLPVTDIVCGVGPFPSCRVLTSSVDHSVKVSNEADYDLITVYANSYLTALGPIFSHSSYHVPISQADILLSMGHHGAFIFRCIFRSRRIDTSSESIQETSGSFCGNYYWSDWGSWCNRRHKSRRGRSQDSE